MKKSQSIGGNKNKNDIVATQGIQKFFKSAPKSHDLNTKGTSEDPTEAVYIGALKKKLQELANNDIATKVQEGIANEMEQEGAAAVDEVITNLVAPSIQCTECKDWEAKYKNLEKDYMKICTSYAELRIKYDDLLHTKTYSYTAPSDINDCVTSNDGVFTSIEIIVLQSMDLEQKTDSTFILKCLQFAYKNDLSVLCKRTLKGNPESTVISDEGEVAFVPGKDPLSTIKVKRIRELFVERIDKCQLKVAANAVRIKDSYMNKLIATGITNIGKKPT